MKNIIIYKSHWELIEQLSVEQVGNLMKGIAKFCRDEEVSFTDALLTGIWMMMKRDFVVQAQNYEKKKEANKRNGKLGGRPKANLTEDIPQNPSGYLETELNQTNPIGYLQTQPNPQNLKEKEKEKEKEKDIEKEKDNIQLPGKAVSSPAPDLFRNKNLPKLREQEFNEIFFG
jgi:hypothetical protein